MPDGLYYNATMPGHLIHMPKPLSDDQVTYNDGTKATVAQESHDVTTFLYWAANPEAVTRKRTGVRVVLFLASPEAGWITGQSIVVDGGQSLIGF